MIAAEQLPRLYGTDVTDPDGHKIGTLGNLWTDESGQPTWASVKTGLFGTKETLVPLHQAEVEGDHLRVPYAKEQVKDAPNIDADADEPLLEQDIAPLYQHYSLTGTGTTDYETGSSSRGTGYETGTTTGYESRGDVDTDRATGDRVTSDRATGDRVTGDDAMTRSEERLNVGTERQAVGKARLRKYIVTEQVQTTVPVSREEVRLEREPITDANRDDAFSGQDLTESEHEVTLNAERPVVNKETVPVERVRLGKDTVTDEHAVQEEVRKEQIDTDLPDQGNRTI